MLGIMAMVPGLPMMPFLTLAALMGLLSYTITRRHPELAGANAPARSRQERQSRRRQETGPARPRRPKKAGGQARKFADAGHVQIELGYGLVPLADRARAAICWTG